MAWAAALHSTFLLILCFCSMYVTSTSRGTMLVPEKTGFTVTLRHVDSGKNLTKLERIQRGMKRSHKRVQMRLATSDDSSDQSVDASISAGNGEYLMDISIGTPVTDYSAILDTGSDLIWTQCKPCMECFEQPTPIFDPENSSSFSNMSCSSNLCQVLSQSTCAGTDTCEYMYGYGDYSSTQGFMATETFTLGGVSVPNIGFGCGEQNEGEGFSQGAGLVGLGRGSLSLVSQMKETKFAYCLTSMDDNEKKSKLWIGSGGSSSSSSSLTTTPLLQNPSQPTFYYLALQGISVGKTYLSINQSTFGIRNDGSGGLIIDSGTTITYLEETTFNVLAKEFISQMQLPVDNSDDTGLEVCFKMPSNSDIDTIEVPKLVFHFEQGADLELPGKNYMIGDSSMGVVCLAMGSSSGMSIFGNLQQQNMLVTYDLAKQSMSFQVAQCDQV